MITDRIGRHEVLLPINHIYNKIRERKGRKRTGEGIELKITYSSVTDPLGARSDVYCPIQLGMTRTLSNYTVLTVLLMLKSWLVIANQIREFCYSYD